MKWPWVSRREAEMWEKCWLDANARWADANLRFYELLDKYHALKLQGATIPEPVTPREAKEIDPLKQAVLNASIGKPPSVRAAMLKQLAEDVKSVEAGLMTAMDVQRRIETGFTPEDGVPE